MRAPASFIAPAYLNVGESLVRELSKLMSVPGMVSLAGGYPGPELFDREGLRAATDDALREMPVAALQYGPTDGLPGLREQVARLLAARGTRCSPDDVLMTGGSQQGFDLLVRTLLAPGDAAIVERPTYTGPLRVLKVAGVRTLTVGVDAHGLDVDELEALLRDAATPRPKLLYVVPTFANPSGATMPRARRLKLLALAVEHGFVIVEDDPYGQLRFDGEHEPHVAGLVDEVPGSKPWVVHLGSFSKVIAPGLRLGYTVAPPDIRRPLVLAKQLDDISSPGFTQATVQRYLAAGRLDAHLPTILGAYRERAGAMRDAAVVLDALARAGPRGRGASGPRDRAAARVSESARRSPGSAPGGATGGHPSMSAPRRISGPAGRAPRPGPRAEPTAQPPLAERHRNHFFALLPPPAVRKDLGLLAADLPDAVGGRAEPAHRLHLTLLFLGPLPPGHEAALLAAGAAAAAARGPFDVELDHLGRFPRSDVVWVGPSSPPDPALPALHSALRRGCAEVPTARRPDKFAPHVTLLRGSAAEDEVPADPVGPWRWRATRFMLLRTDPSPEGRVYTALGEWALAGAPVS